MRFFILSFFGLLKNDSATALSQQLSRRTDREISRRCAVNHELVGRLRSKFTPSLAGSASERTYTTKHGTQATMNVSRIGKSPVGVQGDENDPERGYAVPSRELSDDCRSGPYPSGDHFPGLTYGGQNLGSSQAKN